MKKISYAHKKIFYYFISRLLLQTLKYVLLGSIYLVFISTGRLAVKLNKYTLKNHSNAMQM